MYPLLHVFVEEKWLTISSDLSQETSTLTLNLFAIFYEPTGKFTWADPKNALAQAAG